MADDKRFVYCKKCADVVGEESDTALTMKTVYVEDNFIFSCVKCHTRNEWRSENTILKSDNARFTELNRLAKENEAGLIAKLDAAAKQQAATSLLLDLTSKELAALKLTNAKTVLDYNNCSTALAECLKKVKK